MDSINDYEADVLYLLNDTRMDHIVNFKTTSTSTLDCVIVNFLVIKIERDYEIDDSYSNKGDTMEL